MKKEIDQVGLDGIKYTNEDDQELIKKYPWVLEDINDDVED